MVRRSRAQWLDLLAKFEASGESIATFCEKKQISPRTFAWWRWQLGNGRRAAPTRKKVRLVAVDVTPPSVERHVDDRAVRIAFAGFDIQVAVGTDVEYISALLGALRSRC